MSRILVAGIGNIFLGDDAFGPELVRALGGRKWPEGVAIQDLGLRCRDLAYTLAGERWRAVIIVDAVRRGQPPGTVFRIVPDLEANGEAALDGHSIGVAAIGRMVRQLGAPLPPLLLVGCEPLRLEPDFETGAGLSAPVEAAIPAAVAMVEACVRELCAFPSEEVVSR